MTILEKLYEMRDETYAAFQSKLTPNVEKDLFIGVRVPLLRKFAKEIKNSPEAYSFLLALPHRTYDENMLHGLLLSEINDFDACLRGVNAFLPYVDNWAVCDIMSPKVFAKHKRELLPILEKWMKSSHTYTCRFGMEMLMSHFLDGDFEPSVLETPAAVRSDEYYVKMMQAWFFATALAKQWDAAVPYIENGALDVWTHNKTIQKAKESYRLTDEQKAYLSSFKKSFKTS